jgi:sugar lactone lactonase YvrE
MRRCLRYAAAMRLHPAVLFVLSAATVCAAKIELVAGGGPQNPPAPATAVQLREPFGVEFTPAGEMVIVEMSGGERVLRVDPMGVLHHVAGNGRKGFSGDGGDPKAAEFNGIHNLAILPDGTIFLADTWNQRVRRLDAQFRHIDTWAGDGRKGHAGDGGPATAASFGMVIQVALDPRSEHLYVADIASLRVRRIGLQNGLVETVAGNGRKGVPPDGAMAKDAPLVDPRAVVPDHAGGFYILERGGHALRYVDAQGRIQTVAGTGKAGLSGDGGTALAATFNGPKHACLDRDGTVLIADAENHVIRRFDPKTNTILRVAGTGKKGAAGLGGDPLACELNRPHGVTIGPDGLLYITDSYNDRILRIAK